jgi:hypothetical protein
LKVTVAASLNKAVFKFSLSARNPDDGRERPQQWFFAMPLCFFRIRNCRYSGASDQGAELADRDAAWFPLAIARYDLKVTSTTGIYDFWCVQSQLSPHQSRPILF